ncbi:transcription elongation factor GreA [Patescibacteria group bacterium]|nr:transcription elongation factor GreA [Patescibacteria group bacterium]MBU1034246.1 transcription elongation factor GreA [Patescibacteria group bacterium]MBU1629864.1 transcription elongation factor GreA [Patescibacteria group bacterium]MBU1907767.1 transcription elongation factor GreA [Patescibacteria group bacterium]
MQIPKRKSQMLRAVDNDEVIFLTPDAIFRLKRERERLDKVERPQAVRDVAEARQKGDLSENAEYQEARARLSRLQSRIFNIDERSKRAKPIEKQTSGRVGLGSTVVLNHGGKKQTYLLVGPHEADILRGRISHLSPLGAALLDHVVNDVVRIQTEQGEKEYTIISVS